MGKVYVLLDVDDTAAMSNMHYGDHRTVGYKYNDPIFDALIENKLQEVYIYTSYDLSGIAQHISDEPSKTSRLKLIQYLQDTKKMQVRGTITTLDPAYGQGPGSYYEQVIKNFESEVLNGTDLKRKHAPVIDRKEADAKRREEELRSRALETSQVQSFLKGVEENELLKNKLEELLPPPPSGARKRITKIPALLYFIEHLKTQGSLDDVSILVFDDSKGNKLDIEALDLKDVYCKVIFVNPSKTLSTTQADYSQAIKNALAERKNWSEKLKEPGKAGTANPPAPPPVSEDLPKKNAYTRCC